MSASSKNVLRTAVLAAMVCCAAGAMGAERMNIVSEGGTAKDWQPAPGEVPATPGYPGIIADKSDEVCVSVGYMLNKDGSTSDFALLKSWSAKHSGDELSKYVDPFARNALAAVQRWRFVPAPDNRKPHSAYTAATFAFSTNANADQAALRVRCQIENLPAFVAKAQADAYRRGDLKKGEMDRQRAQSTDNLYRGKMN